MVRLLIQRLFQVVPTALVLTMVLFLSLAFLPGDATLSALGENATAAQRELLRHELGLDRPVWVQYASWLGNLVQGDLGLSMRSREPVLQMIANQAPVTLELAALSAIFATAVGIPLGVFAAIRQGRLSDALIRITSIAGLSVPYFWVGVILILVFSIWLGWLPPSGYVPFTVSPAKNLQLMILPSATIALSMIGLITRQTRAAVLETMREDYVRTARAKGLPEHRVITAHVLRNALIPIVTVISVQLGHMVGGAVVTETIFSLPGLGRMVVESIFNRDFTVLQGAIVVIVTAVILVNLLTDLAYVVIDKRTAR